MDQHKGMMLGLAVFIHFYLTHRGFVEFQYIFGIFAHNCQLKGYLNVFFFGVCDWKQVYIAGEWFFKTQINASVDIKAFLTFYF